MPPAFHFNSNIGQIALGNNDIAEAYLGNDLVYQKGVAPPPTWPPPPIPQPGRFRPIENSAFWTSPEGSVDYETLDGAVTALADYGTGTRHCVFNGLTNVADGWCGAVINSRNFTSLSSFQLALRIQDANNFVGLRARQESGVIRVQVYDRIGGSFTLKTDLRTDFGYFQLGLNGSNGVAWYPTEGGGGWTRLTFTTGVTAPGAIGFVPRDIGTDPTIFEQFRAGTGAFPEPP